MKTKEEHQLAAKKFIDDTIARERAHEKMTYKHLMLHLQNQIYNWKREHAKLSNKNLFEITDKEYDRMNYLHALFSYGFMVYENYINKEGVVYRFKTDGYKIEVHKFKEEPHKPKYT